MTTLTAPTDWRDVLSQRTARRRANVLRLHPSVEKAAALVLALANLHLNPAEPVVVIHDRIAGIVVELDPSRRNDVLRPVGRRRRNHKRGTPPALVNRRRPDRCINQRGRLLHGRMQPQHIGPASSGSLGKDITPVGRGCQSRHDLSMHTKGDLAKIDLTTVVKDSASFFSGRPALAAFDIAHRERARIGVHRRAALGTQRAGRPAVTSRLRQLIKRFSCGLSRQGHSHSGLSKDGWGMMRRIVEHVARQPDSQECTVGPTRESERRPTTDAHVTALIEWWAVPPEADRAGVGRPDTSLSPAGVRNGLNSSTIWTTMAAPRSMVGIAIEAEREAAAAGKPCGAVRMTKVLRNIPYERLDEDGKRTARRCTAAVLGIMIAGILSGIAAIVCLLAYQTATWIVFCWIVVNIVAVRLVRWLANRRLARLAAANPKAFSPPEAQGFP